MVAACADQLLVHRAPQHAHRHDPRDDDGRCLFARAVRAGAQHERRSTQRAPGRARVGASDRPQAPLAFTFDGRLHSGFEGDVVASALYAQGRALLSRSFKYHRPRGVLTMAGHDANALRAGRRRAERARRPARRSRRHGRALDQPARLARSRPLRRARTLLSASCRSASTTRPSSGRAGPGSLFERPIRELAGLGRLDAGRAAQALRQGLSVLPTSLVVGGGPAGLERGDRGGRGRRRHPPHRRMARARRLAALRPRRRRARAIRGRRDAPSWSSARAPCRTCAS